MRAVIAAAAGITLAAGFLATPAQAGGRPEASPRRIVESLDRGLVAVPAQNGGTFLSWRLLGTEYGNNIAFNVYKGATRLNRKPIDESTNFTDTTPGAGVYTVRAVVKNREQAASGPAITPGDIPLLDAPDYYVHHAWPGDLNGDGRYEIVVSRLPYALDQPNYLEAYTLDGRHLWRVDLGVNSYARLGGNAANDPPLAAISGYGEVAGYRNDDNVTVYDVDSDGDAEVFVKTADGVRFADGAVLRSASRLDQFVSVIDGRTGAERERVPVASDFAADGPSGGQYGIAYLDGEHPSLITKQVVRTGAKRGDFRVLIAAWDYDGRNLTRRWTFVKDQGAGFHQLRIVDVDQDGRDDIADGDYVVNSDGTFRYIVAGAVHGDRFHIGDLDPARKGLEGYAIQQTEGGVFTSFPWYYYDAATGERLITGSHPDVPRDATLWDVPRGTTADIDPTHDGYEFWAATANPDLPGAGVWNVDGTRISTTTPSVNFRIWWDGDKGSELLDNTYVEKWNHKRRTTSKIFEPSGVVSSWRNAVPFYGDIIGDWREEYFAETADHTTLRLFTTNIPTDVKLYTLAHDPAYRLGWTVRGYLQSTLTGFHLGYGSNPPARPLIRTTASAGRAWQVIAEDNFVSDSGKWQPELQSGGTVAASNGVLDIDVPNGATVWFRQEISGPYEIEFTATPIGKGGANDHVTDLNTFWNARDVRSPGDIFATTRNGAFAQYDHLRTYYVGQGANLNTTTRFRRYVGEAGNRPLIHDRTSPLIEANVPVRVTIAVDGQNIRYYSDGRLVFGYTDTDPYTSGWFAFRTVASHFHIEDFVVWRPPAIA